MRYKNVNYFSQYFITFVQNVSANDRSNSYFEPEKKSNWNTDMASSQLIIKEAEPTCYKINKDYYNDRYMILPSFCVKSFTHTCKELGLTLAMDQRPQNFLRFGKFWKVTIICSVWQFFKINDNSYSRDRKTKFDCKINHFQNFLLGLS